MHARKPCVHARAPPHRRRLSGSARADRAPHGGNGCWWVDAFVTGVAGRLLVGACVGFARAGRGLSGHVVYRGRLGRVGFYPGIYPARAVRQSVRAVSYSPSLMTCLAGPGGRQGRARAGADPAPWRLATAAYRCMASVQPAWGPLPAHHPDGQPSGAVVAGSHQEHIRRTPGSWGGGEGSSLLGPPYT